MKIIISILGGLALCMVSASASHVVHERRNHHPSEWVRKDEKLEHHVTVPLAVALAQQNLEKGPDYLMSVSDPASSNYGRHWSAEKEKTFASSDITITAVKSWLLDEGIESHRIILSQSRNWLHFNVSVVEAEKLLRTKYEVYEHRTTKKRSLACDEYSLPLTIREHIDFISPTIQFSQLEMRQTRIAKRDNTVANCPEFLGAFSSLNTSDCPPISSWDLKYCDYYTTPACLRALYKLPNGTLDLSSFGVVDFAPEEAYSARDLQLFLQKLNPQIPDTTAPIIELIDEPSYVNVTADLAVGEAILDLSLAISLVYPQIVTLITPRLTVNGTGQDKFDYLLEGLDASYCTVAAPNASDSHGTCGGSPPPSVISVSWGEQEIPDLPAIYIRQCNEYLKLGLQGVTVVYSCGDTGVSNRGLCCDNPGCANQTANFTATAPTFFPQFPASCPWLTAVGGTRIKPGASVADREVVAHEIYIKASGNTTVNGSWESGGGFSNLFAEPAYQKGTLRYYYDHFKPNYTSSQYNDTECVRAYPDLSANGVNTLIVLGGTYILTGGTSSSAPTVGSVITLINEQRIKAGKSTVGFINPVLYANPWALNDIVEGNNPGCGTQGYSAVPGWDPITGLGTPDYEKLLEVFMALP